MNAIDHQSPVAPDRALLSRRRLLIAAGTLGLGGCASDSLSLLGATLPRFGASVPVDTGAMLIERRISATFKDLPGGQVLGPTFDYTHRLLDFALAAEGRFPEP